MKQEITEQYNVASRAYDQLSDEQKKDINHLIAELLAAQQSQRQ